MDNQDLQASLAQTIADQVDSDAELKDLEGVISPATGVGCGGVG